tara:strand:- start:27 stop:623 length:597 start_codon:yes stop_codon:yes gene_type:complete
MKKLVSYIFLFILSFSIPSYSDDIQDLQIEGVSIGDSLLNYTSKKKILSEIKKNEPTYNYLNNDFGEVYLRNNFEEYDFLSFFVKQKDKLYTIYSIAGMIMYDDKIEQCLAKQKEIEKQLSSIFINTKINRYTTKFDWDLTGESTSQNIELVFSSGDFIEINCTKYKKSLKIKNNWSDGLQVTVNKKEIKDWFNNSIN